jgi:hypothetical protein
MGSQARKQTGAAKASLAERMAAWWNGRDPVPIVRAPTAEATLALATDTSLPSSQRPFGKNELRLKALAIAWGADRFAPGSKEIDGHLLGAIFEAAEQSGGIGFIGADPAIMNACRSRTERPIFAAEWRAGCLDRARDVVKTVIMASAEIDRPLPFPERKLEGLVSLDAFTFAGQKPGLVSRAYKSLSGTGRWAAMDLTRTGDDPPTAPFESAFARPQLATAEEIDHLMWGAGFVSVTRQDVSEMVVKAVRGSIVSMGAALDAALKNDLRGPDGEKMLLELARDVESWRARKAALEDGSLCAHLWIADKDPAKKADAAVWTPVEKVLATPKEVRVDAKAMAN